MNFQASLSLLSDVDVIVLQLVTREIVKKTDGNFDAAQFALHKFKEFVGVGKFANRNPSKWVTIEDAMQSDEASFDSFDAQKEQIRNSPDYNVKILDLDNNSNVIEVTFNVNLLVVNCKDLSKEQIKEIKCAKVYTPYGATEIHVQRDRDI